MFNLLRNRRNERKRKEYRKRTYLYIDEGLRVGDVAKLLDIPIEVVERIRRERDE